MQRSHAWTLQVQALPVIRWPLLARATKAAGVGFIVFLSISSQCYSVIRLFFYVFRRPKYHHDLPHQITNSRILTTPKYASFSSLFSRLNKSQKLLPRLPKNDQKPFRNSLNTNSMTIRFFDIHSMRKPRFGSPKRRHFNSEIDKK